jgi:shikimate dehydrogenase
MGLEGNYRLFHVPPFPEGESALSELLACLRDGELLGLNVTIPHKQNVMAYVDDLSSAARGIGAVNTVYLRGERLMGDNTDAPGFLTDLKRFMDSVLGDGSDRAWDSRRRALILGAGGSARAVTYALLEDGWDVTVAARRWEQAEQLVNSFQLGAFNGRSSGETLSRIHSRIVPVPLEETIIRNLKSPIHLIVNATPVGMWPHVETSPWPKSLPFPFGALVYDLVYNPSETGLVKAARSAGLAATTGLGMLVEQAALALERWTDRPVPRPPMWEAVSEFTPPDPLKGGAS